MKRLRIYSRGTGRCQYDSERGPNVDEQSDRIKKLGANGLLFYCDGDREVMCHIEATRKAPEQFIAHYVTDEPTADLLAEFQQRVEMDLETLGWSLSTREGIKHDAFRALPPDPVDSADLFDRVITAIDEDRATEYKPETMAFGAPDIRSAMRLVEHLRETLPEGQRELLVSTDGSLDEDIDGVSPQVRIDRRRSLDDFEFAGDTRTYMNRVEYENRCIDVRENVKALWDEGASAAWIADELTLEDQGIDLWPDGERSERMTELFDRNLYLSFLAGTVLSVLAVIATTWELFATPVMRPAVLSLQPVTVAGYTMLPGFRQTLPSGALVAISFVPIGALCWELKPMASSIREPTDTPDGGSEDGGSLERIATLEEDIRKLGEYEFVSSAAEHRKRVQSALQPMYSVEVFDPEVTGRELLKTRVLGILIGGLFGMVVGAVFWLTARSFVDYWRLVVELVFILGLASFGTFAVLSARDIVRSARSGSESTESDEVTGAESADIEGGATADSPTADDRDDGLTTDLGRTEGKASGIATDDRAVERERLGTSGYRIGGQSNRSRLSGLRLIVLGALVIVLVVILIVFALVSIGWV